MVCGVHTLCGGGLELEGSEEYSVGQSMPLTMLGDIVSAAAKASTNLYALLDGNTNVCEDIGRQLLTYGRRMTPAEIFKRIEELTVEDAKAAAYKVFHDKDHAMAAVGNIDKLPSYEWIRNHSFLEDRKR